PFVEVVEDVCCFSKSMLAHKDGWVHDIRNASLHFMRRLGLNLIRSLNLAEIRNQRLQQLAPGLKSIRQYVRRRALRRYRGGESSVDLLVAVNTAEPGETARLQTPLTAASLQAV